MKKKPNNESYIQSEYMINIQTTERIILIRLIPQGTVDNNLWLDCLAGPKALDPNYCRTNPLIARPLSESPNFA